MLKHVQSTSSARSCCLSRRRRSGSSTGSFTSLSSSSTMTGGVGVDAPSSCCCSPTTFLLNDTLSSSGMSSNNSSSASSNSSATSAAATVTMRLYTQSLLADVEYRTMVVQYSTTCQQLIQRLLTKYRMKHRDPKMFSICMEVTTRRTGEPVQTILLLEDSDCPAPLLACHPSGARFSVRMRRGGVVRVHDGVLMRGSRYKSLLVSERTSASDVICLLLNCSSNFTEDASRYCLFQTSNLDEVGRRLYDNELPLIIQQQTQQQQQQQQQQYSFVLRRKVPTVCKTLWPQMTSSMTSPVSDSPLRWSFIQWSENRRPKPVWPSVEGENTRSALVGGISIYDNAIYI